MISMGLKKKKEIEKGWEKESKEISEKETRSKIWLMLKDG